MLLCNRPASAIASRATSTASSRSRRNASYEASDGPTSARSLWTSSEVSTAASIPTPVRRIVGKGRAGCEESRWALPGISATYTRVGEAAIVAALFLLGILLFIVGPPGLGAIPWAVAGIYGGFIGYQRLRGAENPRTTSSRLSE